MRLIQCPCHKFQIIGWQKSIIGLPKSILRSSLPVLVLLRLRMHTLFLGRKDSFVFSAVVESVMSWLERAWRPGAETSTEMGTREECSSHLTVRSPIAAGQWVACQADSRMILVFWLCIFIWTLGTRLLFRDSLLLDYSASDPLE